MSINVTLGEVKTQEVKPFPKLMKSADGLIVLFTKAITGTVIYAPTSNTEPLGHHSTTWNPDAFTDYNEPITLQNA